jgi:hypothetical protein
MKNNMIMITFCYLFLAAGVVDAKTLLDQVKESSLLLDGNIAILTHGGNRSLVSVGVSEVDTTNLSSVKWARTTAKVRAQNQLSQFINDVSIEVIETMKDKVEIIEENGQPVSRQEGQTYLEHIKETNRGALKNFITLGSWTDSTGYYHVIVMPLK